MNGDTWIFLALCGALLVFLLMASFLSKSYSLNNIKSKTVGDGQHGTARWATPKEIGKTYHTVEMVSITGTSHAKPTKINISSVFLYCSTIITCTCS